MGLSPRVRGNREQRPLRRSAPGSIPACAGEPRRSMRGCSRSWVYPRVCGGTSVSVMRCSLWRGLSPRVRGNRGPTGCARRARRSIPACAGEPRGRAQGAGRQGVYPRVCGGTSPERCTRPTSEGLSPRVRGNRDLDPEGQGQQGSIPACAGEPLQGLERRRLARVYPRVCGGTQALPRHARQVPGLSPRVRGNPPHCRTAAVPPGSIPACAGEP